MMWHSRHSFFDFDYIWLWSYTHVLAGVAVDDVAGLAAVEVRRGDDELGDVEGKETVAIETARMALWQHKGFGDRPLGIDVTEIGTREEAVVTARAEHKPAGVGAPVVERLGVVGVSRSHGAIFK